MSLRVSHPGLFSSIQDKGRFGLRALGIPKAGVGCVAWMQFANELLSQPDSTPVIETVEGGLTLVAEERSETLALIGDVDADITRSDGTKQLASSWRTYRLNKGDSLRIKSTGRYRTAVVGIKSLSIKPHFDSCSTYAKAGLGGINGSALSPGDTLKTKERTQHDNEQTQHDAELPERTIDPFRFAGECSASASSGAPQGNVYEILAVPGPQDDYFSDAALTTLFNEPYTVTPEIDRLGARLSGPLLQHLSAKHKDIVSDATIPGSIQVPGVGLPIVMLPDANTIGGYPKIATVVSADVALFTLCRPGDNIRFVKTDTAKAREHSLAVIRSIKQHMSTIRSVESANFSSEYLLKQNLISGVSNGQPEKFEE